MEYSQLRNKYLAEGLQNCELKTRDDTKNILGIDIDSIKGIEALDDSKRNLFTSF